MTPESEGKAAAQKFREVFRLGLEPIEDIVELVGMTGADVVGIPAGTDDHGLTAQDEQTGAIVVIVSTSVPSVRFRSNVAHELGHIQFPEDLQVTETHSKQGSNETRAQSFARHLLLPVEAVEAEAAARPDAPHRDLLNHLVRHYGLSPTMAAYQMQRARIIDETESQQFCTYTCPRLAKIYGWTDLNDARDEAVTKLAPPQHLAQLSIEAYRKGVLSPAELAVVLRTTVKKVVADYGQPPVQAKTARRKPIPTLADDDLVD